MTQTQKKYQSISNYTIDNYIQRVSELSQSGQKIPTNEELEKIASELGISTAEIEIAKKQSEDHFVRSQGYMNLKHWDDAINELQEAVVFNPSNLEMLNLLANAHLGRWLEKHLRDDELQIKIRIKQCLEIKPDHQESLQLLAKLDHFSQEHQKKKVLLTALLTVFVGSIIGYFFLNDITINLFNKKDVQLENLKLELKKEIDEARTEEKGQWNDFVNSEDKKHQLNQEKISQAEQQIKKLEQQNIILNQKITELQKQIENLTEYIINKEKSAQNKGKN